MDSIGIIRQALGGCPTCGRDVLQPRTGRPRVYCDQRCRQTHWRGKHKPQS